MIISDSDDMSQHQYCWYLKHVTNAYNDNIIYFPLDELRPHSNLESNNGLAIFGIGLIDLTPGGFISLKTYTEL